MSMHVQRIRLRVRLFQARLDALSALVSMQPYFIMLHIFRMSQDVPSACRGCRGCRGC